MTNVAEFKTNRNPSTALVVVDQMTPKEALTLHTAVKDRGRGAVKKFAENETIHGSYGNYYYHLTKLGVMPLNPRGTKSTTTTLTTQTKKGAVPAVVSELEQRIKQLELQLQTTNATPAKRAVDILSSGLNELGDRARGFLCSIISRNSAGLTSKQEKWLTSLEDRFL